MAYDFSYEEDKLILENRDKTAIELGKLLNLSYRTIVGRLRSLKGLTIEDLDHEKEYIIKNYNDMKAGDIALVLDRCVNYIYSRVRILVGEGLLEKKTSFRNYVRIDSQSVEAIKSSRNNGEYFDIDPMPRVMKLVKVEDDNLWTKESFKKLPYEKGKIYKIKTDDKEEFEGVLDDETDSVLVFKHYKHGYTTSYSKVNFLIGQYSIKAIS